MYKATNTENCATLGKLKFWFNTFNFMVKIETKLRITNQYMSKEEL